MEWLKKNRFWILLAVNVCVGFLGGWVSFVSSLLCSFLLIWLNYRYTSERKKMLLLDVVLLVSTQAGLWLSYLSWLRNTENIDVGASLIQMFNILVFLADGFFILVMFTWSFIVSGKKKAAWITGSIVCAGMIFLGVVIGIVSGI